MNIVMILYLALILGGCFFIFLAIQQYLKAKKAENAWPTASGVVLDSEMKVYRNTRSRGSSSKSYLPSVTYQYQVKDQNYSGDRLGFGRATYGRGKAEGKLALYPQGAPVTVHYDPADPSRAVLETKALSLLNYLALGIILLATGIITAWVM